MHTNKKMWLTALAVTMAGSAVAGCSGSDSGGSSASPSASPNSSPASTATAPAAPEAVYPLKTDATLSYWTDLNGNVRGVKSTYDEVPFFQEWQKRTGVKLKFIHPAANQGRESLNVMLASGELPDLIEYTWGSFPGGPEKAIKDGYILKLNDYIDKYAPNLKKYLAANPDIDKQVKTDDGSYYVFPFIRGDDMLKTFQGPIIRKDLLDELGLQIPTTMDEWYTVLKAFKAKGIDAPLSFHSVPNAIQGLGAGAFIGAYGVIKGYYQEDGKVKFGPIESGYKAFLETFAQWYKEGLLDKSIATVDGTILDANMTSGKSVVSVWNSGSGIGRWLPPLKEKVPTAQLVAAPYPVLNKGDTPKFGQKDLSYSFQGSTAISAKSKNIEAAVRLMDYAYSEEGHLLFNFGIPGVSYNLENGYPKYTDLLMKNPDKLSPAQAISQYARSSYNGPFVQDKRYIEQFLALPEQKEAVVIWSKTDVAKHQLPQITPTVEESAEFARIMNDVNTLVDEMTMKIILGAEPASTYDSYVTKIKSLKIDRAIEIQQSALERFNKR